jgi:hypothetical protein
MAAPALDGPPWQVKKRVDAGATRDMIDPDVYGDYELSISDHTDTQEPPRLNQFSTVA